MIRIHICWGNYEGPHTHDISLEKILPIILKAKVKYLLIESSNPRHSHEWKIFGDIKLPHDKVLIPGLIDSTSNFVEHPEVVADRVIQFSTVVPKDQLMAGTDCGFSTFAGFGKIDENWLKIMFYELRSKWSVRFNFCLKCIFASSGMFFKSCEKTIRICRQLWNITIDL